MVVVVVMMRWRLSQWVPERVDGGMSIVITGKGRYVSGLAGRGSLIGRETCGWMEGGMKGMRRVYVI